MRNHFYTINGEIRRQSDGSPIGLDISVEITGLYMSSWDRKFLSLCKRTGLKILLYKRYVDDTVILLKEINPGWVWDQKSKKMIYSPQDPSAELPGDQRTFLALVEIANGIDRDIQMTSDVPSVHQDGTLPVLALSLKVVDNQVIWTFFSKPCTSPYTILYRSALSEKKRGNSSSRRA